MQSLVKQLDEVKIPYFDGEMSMIPFNLFDLKGVPEYFKGVVNNMTKHLIHRQGEAFLTVHGKTLKKNQTLRRGGAHTDGSYDKLVFDWGGGGWKVGQVGPGTSTEDHKNLYLSNTGGIIITSNFESCLGWSGEFDGVPGRGGDCSHITLGEPFMLKRNKIYYGNNHFIHESIPVSEDCHRVMVRITLPKDHKYEE